MQFLRYPRTRPNDFTLLRIKEFLKKDAGNQLILNPMDVWQVFEGDYDVDMGDAFWAGTKEMIDHSIRGTQTNIISEYMHTSSWLLLHLLCSKSYVNIS